MTRSQTPPKQMAKKLARLLRAASTAERETRRAEFRTERIEEHDALNGPSVLRVLSQHVRDLRELRGRPDERVPE